MKYLIYTDGACSNNGKEGAIGGWGAIVLNEETNSSYELSGFEKPSTNNRMELMAPLRALESLKLNPFDEVVVKTDSAYLHNCYTAKWWVSWERNGWKTSQKKPVLNKSLWEELIPYFKNPNIYFEKVKGHSDGASNDSYWNNMVDKLAVHARENLEVSK